VVGYYTDAGGEVLDIDANKPIDIVTAEIIEKIESLLPAK
jgi:hypothetical protein